MTESSLWSTARRHFAPYGRLKRIENRADNGTPDVYYSFPGGRRGWIELKHLDRWPARPGTPIRIDHLTLDQVLWLEEEARMGGRAFLLLQVDRTYILLQAWHARLIYEGEMTQDKLRKMALVCEDGAFPALEIIQFLRALSP